MINSWLPPTGTRTRKRPGMSCGCRRAISDEDSRKGHPRVGLIEMIDSGWRPTAKEKQEHYHSERETIKSTQNTTTTLQNSNSTASGDWLLQIQSLFIVAKTTSRLGPPPTLPLSNRPLANRKRSNGVLHLRFPWLVASGSNLLCPHDSTRSSVTSG